MSDLIKDAAYVFGTYKAFVVRYGVLKECGWKLEDFSCEFGVDPEFFRGLDAALYEGIFGTIVYTRTVSGRLITDLIGAFDDRIPPHKKGHDYAVRF